MNIDLMRKLDYYLGIPLCFLGTLLKKTVGLFGSGRSPVRRAHVLFIELSEMGSVILVDPAMMKLKKSLMVNLYFAIFRKNSPSLDFLDTVPRENIFIMGDSGLWSVAVDTVRFICWTRKNRIDTVIDLELFSRFTALLTGASGAAHTVGFHAFFNDGLYRGDFLTHKVAYNPHQHISKNFVALVNALLSDNGETPYSKTVIGDDEIVIRKVAVSAKSRQAMREKIRAEYPLFDAGRQHLILLNTNASDMIPLRRWPQEYYISLARKILEEHRSAVILLTGSPDERSSKEAIITAVGSGRCLNFAGRTSLSELTALYSVSSFMLTNDSGPAHFAAVTDLPVFVLFGPETPAIYGPLGRMTPIYAGLACSPCVSATNHRQSACNDNVCLQVITVEQVYETLEPVLVQVP
jgi:ADP-heptose:LPS heptosyltransferase